jgi:hypothetical protein
LILFLSGGVTDAVDVVITNFLGIVMKKAKAKEQQ